MIASATKARASGSKGSGSVAAGQALLQISITIFDFTGRRSGRRASPQTLPPVSIIHCERSLGLPANGSVFHEQFESMQRQQKEENCALIGCFGHLQNSMPLSTTVCLWTSCVAILTRCPSS
jgi:hypothetical protein